MRNLWGWVISVIKLNCSFKLYVYADIPWAFAVYIIPEHILSKDCTAAAWLNTTGTCFNGALPFLEYKSVDDCLTACSCYVSGCIAAFVRNATDGTVQCYMNKRSDSLADLWSCPSVTQYVVLGSQGKFCNVSIHSFTFVSTVNRIIKGVDSRALSATKLCYVVFDFGRNFWHW